MRRRCAPTTGSVWSARSVAPVAGAAFASFLDVPPLVLMLYLGFFAGFLLYIGAADVLPEAHTGARSRDALLLIALTCAGAAFAYLAGHLAERL